MNVKIVLLSIALIAATLIACEFGSQTPTDGDASQSSAFPKPTETAEPNATPEPTETPQSKQGWFPDTRPLQIDVDVTIDDPGIAVESNYGDAILFVSCDLLSVAIDWSTALLLGSMEIINTTEIFYRDHQYHRYSYDWYGSIFSRKRVVRYEPFLVPMSSGDLLNTQDFIREFAKNEQIDIAQGRNETTFNLLGFEDAFGKHCS